MWHFWGVLANTLEGHTDAVLDVAISADSKVIASASEDHTVRLWDSASGQFEDTLADAKDAVLAVVFSPDGRFLATGCSDGLVPTFDVVDKQEHKLLGHHAKLNCVAFSPDSTKLASGSSDRTVKIWDPMSGMQLKELNGHISSVNCLTFSPDGLAILTGSWMNWPGMIWGAGNGKKLRMLQGLIYQVTGVAYSPDSTKVITLSVDRSIGLWDAATGQQLAKVLGGKTPTSEKMTPMSVALSPDGTIIVVGSADGVIYAMGVRRLTDASTGSNGYLNGQNRRA